MKIDYKNKIIDVKEIAYDNKVALLSLDAQVVIYDS
jgi:hypothetical protein